VFETPLETAMLDPRHVADHPDEVRAQLSRRSAEAAAQLDSVRPLIAKRRELIVKTESLQQERNRASEDMARLAKSGDKEAMAERRGALKALSDQVKELADALLVVENELESQLIAIPNVPHPSVPDGATEEDNPVIRTWGEPPRFDFEPKAHWEIGEQLGILDFERASKLSGARFAVLWGLGARLERALITFMLDLHTREHGYTEVYPPFLVRAEALRGTGQLPKFEQDLFKTQRQGSDDTGALYLIPTAEVPVTNLHANEILEGAALPLAYCAYTPCFRSEAGSYGKDVRGIIRQHQFDKIELVRFVRPEQGLEELERLTLHAEEVLRRLGLHYRVVEHVPPDLGATATKGYDLEVWIPSQRAFREISSCSWFGDYQARRAQIRYRPEPKGKPRLLHTLNGSGLAVGRTWLAILEQYQTGDGSVVVPEPLRPFMGVDRITPRG
jgi:seryl-tRNA synthetase